MNLDKYECDGQLDIFDIGIETDDRPCRYKWHRYVGQRVVCCGKPGVITNIDSQYYTEVHTDDKQILAGTPTTCYPEKEEKKNCSQCKYRVFLNKDGKRVQSCDRYYGCEFVPAEDPDDFTYDNKGKLSPAPSWMSKKRCEKCQNWSLSPNQPPEGWGVMGFCSSHRGRGKETNHTSYCDDYIERSVFDEG